MDPFAVVQYNKFVFSKYFVINRLLQGEQVPDGKGRFSQIQPPGSRLQVGSSQGCRTGSRKLSKLAEKNMLSIKRSIQRPLNLMVRPGNHDKVN